MSLVDRQRLPLDIAQLLRIPQRQLISSQQDIHLELLIRRSEFVIPNHLAGGRCSDICDDIDIRGPGLELGLPGGDGGKRDDHEEGAVLVHFVKEVGKESDGLDGLFKKVSGRRYNAVQPYTKQTFPRPISSARIPFSPLLQTYASQFNPVN